MNIDKPSSRKRFVLLSARLMLIVALWLGGTYVFESLHSLNVFSRVPTSVQADGAVNIWWPSNNARLSGLQPFKAMVQDKNITDYDMFWQVDGGQLNRMGDSYADYPHKEVTVDLSSWTWKGAGPYKITFKAVNKNNTPIADASIDVYRPDTVQSATTVVAPTVTVTDTTSQTSSVEAPQTTTQTTSSTQNSLTATLTGVQTASATVAPTNTTQTYLETVSVLNPLNGSSVYGTLDFKAKIEGLNSSDYLMYWQVDGGQKNFMTGSGSDKVASVNVSGWSWRGEGPYELTFTAERNNAVVGVAKVSIYVKASAAQTSSGTVTTSTSNNNKKKTETQTTTQLATVAPTTTTQPTQTTTQPTAQLTTTQQTVTVAGNPLSGLKFFVNPYSNAKRQADEWRSSRPTDASQMDKIAQSSEAVWLGGWNADVESDVRNKISAAKSQGAIPVFIAYNIPQRDCGSYSAGGVSGADAYKSWIQKIANGLGGNKAVVVLEPDALSLTDCLSAEAKTARFNMISAAVSTLKSSGAVVYIDAGHPGWVSADDMAARLKSAGIDKADGFALNVSNFKTTSENITYGTSLSGKVNGKHFIIDTARNGLGANGDEWCNPAGRALGTRSTIQTGNSLVDAFLWLKNPGESDGNCNGGPSAGVWWPEYALGLAQRAAF
jgi:endoglucanase